MARSLEEAEAEVEAARAAGDAIREAKVRRRPPPSRPPARTPAPPAHLRPPSGARATRARRPPWGSGFHWPPSG